MLAHDRLLERCVHSANPKVDFGAFGGKEALRFPHEILIWQDVMEDMNRPLVYHCK